MVLLEQAVEDLDASGRAHGPAPHLPVGVEAMIERHILPAVRGHHGVVELDVDCSKSRDVLINCISDLRGVDEVVELGDTQVCLLYTSPSPRDGLLSRM